MPEQKRSREHLRRVGSRCAMEDRSRCQRRRRVRSAWPPAPRLRSRHQIKLVGARWRRIPREISAGAIILERCGIEVPADESEGDLDWLDKLDLTRGSASKPFERHIVMSDGSPRMLKLVHIGWVVTIREQCYIEAELDGAAPGYRRRIVSRAAADDGGGRSFARRRAAGDPVS